MPAATHPIPLNAHGDPVPATPWRAAFPVPALSTANALRGIDNDPAALLAVATGARCAVGVASEICPDLPGVLAELAESAAWHAGAAVTLAAAAADPDQSIATLRGYADAVDRAGRLVAIYGRALTLALSTPRRGQPSC